jgi:hypothetical protein
LHRAPGIRGNLTDHRLLSLSNANLEGPTVLLPIYGYLWFRERNLATAATRPSFRLDVRGLDDGPPFRDLGFLQLTQCLRGLLLARRNLISEVDEALAQLGFGQDIHDRGIEL